MDNNLLVDIAADEYAWDDQRRSIQPRWNIHIRIRDTVTDAHIDRKRRQHQAPLTRAVKFSRMWVDVVGDFWCILRLTLTRLLILSSAWEERDQTSLFRCPLVGRPLMAIRNNATFFLRSDLLSLILLKGTSEPQPAWRFLLWIYFEGGESHPAARQPHQSPRFTVLPSTSSRFVSMQTGEENLEFSISGQMNQYMSPQERNVLYFSFI